ncbi:MAG: hypothetical protein Q9174_006262 [Haloplaca sp. 1 TL-2023]
MVAIRSLALLAALATAITASPVIQGRQEQGGAEPQPSGVSGNPNEEPAPNPLAQAFRDSQDRIAREGAAAQEGGDAPADRGDAPKNSDAPPARDAQEGGGQQAAGNTTEAGAAPQPNTAETTDGEGNTFVFRTDLQENRQGLSPRFKNLLSKSLPKLIHQFPLPPSTNIFLLVSTVASSSASSGFEITFINIDERDSAATGVVKSASLPLKASDGSTLFFTPGVDASNPSGAQPVTLETEQKGSGSFFQLNNELRLGSVNPPFDSWIICDGEGHPTLKWLGAPGGRVGRVQGCDFVRLFVESPPS